MAIDSTKEKLGIKVRAKLDQYIADRSMLEQQWLKNLRQYRGEYDPEVLARIPEGKSKAYPRDTRTKIKGFVAKMMEMMFPATEKNWMLKSSPVPSIAAADLDLIIKSLQQREMQQAMAEEREPIPLTGEQIEVAVKQFADARKDAMEQLVEDQLMDPDIDWPQLCKRVIRSGGIFGFGVVKAPLIRSQVERTWKIDEKTGAYVAVTQKVRRPYPEFVQVWDIYPDLTAQSWSEQEGIFERIVLSRNSFSKLAERPGFDAKAISQYLKDKSEGNYVSRAYEPELRELNKADKSTLAKGDRRYEVFRWYGFISAHDLKSAGVDVPDNKMDKDILAEVWMIDDVIIQAELAPFGERVSDVYHVYIYTEDESAGLTGLGIPEELRDRQLSICASTRALYDNMASTAGPIYEVATNLLKKGQDYKTMHSFKVLEREGDANELAFPAVRAVATTSHIPEIQGILADERQQFDIESNLPSWTLGNAQPLGEAFRTTSNMSQMTGGANMVTKDHVRAFDKFTSSVIGAFVAYNMEFGPEEVKGDFQVVAKGNLSLVAKEIRGAALDQFVMTLTPQERAMLKTREVLIERLRSRDLPLDVIVSADEAARIQQSMAEAQNKAAAAEEEAMDAKTQKTLAEAERIRATLPGQVEEIMARIRAVDVNNDTKKTKAQLDTISVMMSNLISSAKEQGTPYA